MLAWVYILLNFSAIVKKKTTAIVSVMHSSLKMNIFVWFLTKQACGHCVAPFILEPLSLSGDEMLSEAKQSTQFPWIWRKEQIWWLNPMWHPFYDVL